MIIAVAGATLLSMVFTVLTVYYVVTVGMNPLQLVLVGTTLELTVFLFEIPTGVVADTYSRRLSVIIGYALIGLCYVITGFVPAFIIILAAEFLRGIGETFISGATSAWIADELGDHNVGRAFVRYQQLSLAGGFAGTVAGAWLGSQRLSLPIWLGGAGILVLVLFLIFAMPEHGFNRTSAPDRETWRGMWHTTRDGMRVVRVQPVVLMFLLVAVVFGAFSEGFDRLWEAHYLANIAFPTVIDLQPVAWIAIIRSGSLLMGVVVSEGIMRRVNLDNTRALSLTLLFATALLALSVIGFGLASGFVVATLIFWLAGGLRAVQYPISQTWLNRNIPSRVRATVLSMVSQADAFGQVAGGPVVGAVGLRSLRAAMVMSGLLLTPALFLYGRGVNLTNDNTNVE
jgi:DHA3 family tetracycline resistance protein-like MFS transporter